MQQAHIMTLDVLAVELTTLAPNGIFKDWLLYKRLGFLYGLENAMLDPDGMLMQAGLPIRISQVQNFETRTALRQQIVDMDIQGLAAAFDNAVLRADLAGGHLHAAELLLNPEGFAQGDIRAGVNRFFGNADPLRHGPHLEGPGLNFFDVFPWLKSPLVGCRDYLVDIWVKRATRQLKEGQLLDANGAVQQLNNRFHQDFRTGDVGEQPANRVLNAILLRILKAPVGTDFGFGIVPAAIEPQSELTDREYLDYLISLTGESQHELENRYRLNLSRSGFDVSSPVQQNIETLQRFFTDSFQSPFDPHAILPPLTGNGLPIINEYTYPGQAHSPFFWQYEEWLERNEPFYAENYNGKQPGRTGSVRRFLRAYPGRTGRQGHPAGGCLVGAALQAQHRFASLCHRNHQFRAGKGKNRQCGFSRKRNGKGILPPQTRRCPAGMGRPSLSNRSAAKPQPGEGALQRRTFSAWRRP
jgi:hypothetical protein